MDQLIQTEEAERTPLVTLREDLDMWPGTPTLEGYPTWVIHDRFRHIFYNIGLTEYEILRRWHLNDVDAIVDDILHTTTLYVNAEDVEFLNDYLLRNQFAVVETEQQRQELTEGLDKKKKFNPLALFKMLMFQIRLARPDRFLNNTYWMVRFAFTKQFWWFMLVMASAGIFLVIRDFSAFAAQAGAIFTVKGAAFILVALVISKVFHEFGHAYTCKHLGLAVPKFGLRLMIILPFFYTDTNESWKLKSRRQRFMIGAGGLLSELILAIFAMLLWGILDDGFGRSLCFYLFVTSLVASLAINMTPFLKWDGYYMFSDMVGIPNLQRRGFALGKWQLREWLFGWKEEIPLKLTSRMHKVVVGYAYGAWVKRTVVFLAIGLLIFQKVFKVLGIFLLTMQLTMFIGKPVYNEVKYWITNRKKMKWNKHSITTAAVFASLLVWLFVPWQTTIRVPAAISPRVQAILYTPDAAQVGSVSVSKGDEVSRNQVLASLKNVNLEYDIRLAKSNVDILRNSLDRFGNQQFLESRSVMQQELQAAIERTTGLIDTFRKLTIIAPFDGVVVNSNSALKPGHWLAGNTAVMVVADKSSLEIYGYIPESDLTRVVAEGEAVFYPENPQIPPITGRVIDVDQAETTILQHAMLSNLEGGTIPVKRNPELGLVPTKAFYRVRLSMQPEDIARVTLESRGSLHLEGKAHSIGGDVYRKAVSVLIRESGF